MPKGINVRQNKRLRDAHSGNKKRFAECGKAVDEARKALAEAERKYKQANIDLGVSSDLIEGLPEIDTADALSSWW